MTLNGEDDVVDGNADDKDDDVKARLMLWTTL